MLPHEVKMLFNGDPCIEPIERIIRKDILDGNFHCSLSGPEADALFDLLKYSSTFVEEIATTLDIHPDNEALAIEDLLIRIEGFSTMLPPKHLLKECILLVKQEMLKQFVEHLGFVMPPAIFMD